jgi:HlyD family secretion protein
VDIVRPELTVKKQKRQRWIAAGALTALLLLALCISVLQRRSAVPIVPKAGVWIDQVKRGELLREVRGSGQLVPLQARWVAAASAARVESILLKPGSTVRADSVLMQLSNPDLVESWRSAQADVAAAEADLIAREVDLDNQLIDLQTIVATSAAEWQSDKLQADAEREMALRGIVSALQAKRSTLAMELAEKQHALHSERVSNFRRNRSAQLMAARARLQQLRSTSAARKQQLDALQVHAGLDGVLQDLAVEVGQQLAVGSNLARVAKLDVLIARLQIPELQAKDISVGLATRIDTRNGLVDGAVSRIDPQVKAGTVQVDIALHGALPAGARVDLTVDGRIEIERLHDVLQLARPAFAQGQSQQTLFVLDADGFAAQRAVRLGRASFDKIEVVSGLSIHDRVLVSDTSAFSAHQRVRIQ